ncbi:hypothetical protein BCB4_0120 [Bacillus phage B4]|uniref:Uncharacterized protein n=2 Tax=Bequatrovirus B4 TaxID=1918005 RepID=J9PRT2_9CAUD|nr:hypothetical protein BCB4_0120 [Bacillus phage B4]YP_009783712.1 hypothetical protein QLX26_gp116 [Bacillus phage B5S]AEW47350.1 hypothetical protein B5S_0116 [Bacillus phage B5S]AEZ65913.1 hypothetical protein BCB4_0120 [Bacillus phage B4]
MVYGECKYSSNSLQITQEGEDIRVKIEGEDVYVGYEDIDEIIERLQGLKRDAMSYRSNTGE